MKSKILFITMLVLYFNTLYSQRNMAIVNKVEGYYIFTDCKPVSDYEVVDVVSTTFSLGSSQYTALRDRLLKKAKKTEKQFDGLIFTFVTGGTDKAELIKFKIKDENSGKARVNTSEGLCLFIDSEPLNKNEYIGSVKVVFTMTSQYADILSKFAKNCRKQYPESNGLIMRFADGSTDKGDAIKISD